jgi:microfibrillar-associated protein 1
VEAAGVNASQAREGGQCGVSASYVSPTRHKLISLTMYRREREREEIEARRALPEALRLKEDTERAAALRAGKMANRGQQNFLQKYHHKGAFYADDEIMSRYDYTAPTESAVRDVSALPAAMQVRNFGKMGRTKYTHLVDQDTSDRNAGWSGAGSSRGKQGADHLNQGCFNCGGNHMKKDCPQLVDGMGLAGASGANAGPIGRRRRNSRSPSPPRRDSRRRSRSRDRDRSRSRSPPRRDSNRGSDRYERSRDSYRPSDRDGPKSDRDRDDKRRRYD